MPEFRRFNADEVSRMWTRSGPKRVDLTEYTDFLQQLESGDWGEVTMEASEGQRAVKRRLTTAANRMSKAIRYRSTEGRTIRFEVR